MSTRSRRPLVLSAAATVAISCVSCDKSPTSPSQGPSSPPGAIVRLELVAPREIAPGESVQLTANAIKSNGSVDNVTSQALWTVQPGSVLTVTRTGLATGGDDGRGLVTVRFSGFTADATIIVLPKGTFILAGTVSVGAVGLENVTVTVISGVGAGLTARTAPYGDYALYGVSGPVQILASKDQKAVRCSWPRTCGSVSIRFAVMSSRRQVRPSLQTDRKRTVHFVPVGYPFGYPRAVLQRPFDQEPQNH